MYLRHSVQDFHISGMELDPLIDLWRPHTLNFGDHLKLGLLVPREGRSGRSGRDKVSLWYRASEFKAMNGENGYS